MGPQKMFKDKTDENVVKGFLGKGELVDIGFLKLNICYSLFLGQRFCFA